MELLEKTTPSKTLLVENWVNQSAVIFLYLFSIFVDSKTFAEGITFVNESRKIFFSENLKINSLIFLFLNCNASEIKLPA